MAKHVGLGRGLGALIKDTSPAPAEDARGTESVPIDEIRKSPWQPRREFAPDALEELASSITEQGLIQPLVVRRVKDGYELIAGERRLRASGIAGLKTVPVILLDVTDQTALELALVENLQREDLNVIEEAEGYRLLGEKFKLTQEKIAERVGKARATIANSLRLLDLSDSIRQLLAEGQISAGHAKVLLQLEIPRERELLAQRAAREGLSVRALEHIVARLKSPGRKRKKKKAKSDIPEDYVHHLTDTLYQHFGTSVRLHPCVTQPNGKKSKGRIEIDFFSNDELDRILTILGVSDAL